MGNMKLNVSYPANGSQKLFEIEDGRKLNVFMEKRMGAEVPGDSVGDEFKGYIFRITGGNDKQGFPMKQGVMVPGRVKLLLSEGHSCYRPRRAGERKRKSVHGCIVGMDMSVLALSIVKKGDEDIPGLTDVVHPKRLGPSVRPRSAGSSASPRMTMSASTSSAVRSSPRARARPPTPRLPRSSAWSLPSASSTSVTALPSSAARPRRSRTRPTSTPRSWPSVSLRPRPTRPTPASVVLPPCASKRQGWSGVIMSI